MAAVKDKKMVSGPFSNESELVRVLWDFDVDGGALATLDLLEAQGDVLISLKALHVRNQVTSGGALLMDVGEANGNEMLNDVPKADMGGNAIKVGLIPISLVAGEKIGMTFAGAAASAGKIEFIFELMKVASA